MRFICWRITRLPVAAAIDNLCRVASGQAVLGASLLLGLPETEGLPLAVLVPVIGHSPEHAKTPDRIAQSGVFLLLVR